MKKITSVLRWPLASLKGSGYDLTIQILIRKLICNSPPSHVVTSTNWRYIFDTLHISRIYVKPIADNRTFSSVHSQYLRYIVWTLHKNQIKIDNGLLIRIVHCVSMGLFTRISNRVSDPRKALLACFLLRYGRKPVLVGFY